MYTICVLLYGDHPHLARRCLNSLAEIPEDVMDVRLGLNEVCPETDQIVQEFCARHALRRGVHVYRPPFNVGKGPLMRRMFYDPELTLRPWVMWFDDDSYLDPTCGESWWHNIGHELETKPAVLGCPHSIRIRGKQHLAIPQQPWYTGWPVVPPGHRYQFITGGWWVADTTFLKKWNFPFPEIWHNGDDSILGELVRQQRRINKRSLWAKCHCESCMRRPSPDVCMVHVNAEGNAGRRGIALKGEIWPWEHYEPGKAPDLSHHNFEIKIDRY